MSRVIRLCTIVAASVLVASAGSFGQNLLLNGGFESGTDTTADNWSQFGNATRETRAAMTGSYGLIEFGNWTGNTNYSAAYQDVPATAGQFFFATVYVATTNYDQIGSANSAFLKLEFYDVSTNFLGSVPAANPLTSASPVDTWILQTVAATAPSNTAFVRTTLIFEQDNGQGGSAYFDNASLQVVPELQIKSLSIVDGTNAVVGFDSLLGAVYQVDARDDMASGSWSVTTSNISGTGGTMQITNGIAPGQQTQFYRLGVTY
jgi:hypothetical protein